MAFNIEEYSLAELVEHMWCVVDTVSGLMHIGLLYDDGNDSTIVLHYPRSVLEDESNQVVLSLPMHFGSPDGVLKLNCNTTNVQFTPCIEIVDAYIASIFSTRQVDDDIYTVETFQ